MKIQCKDCLYYHWEQEQSHGKTERYCTLKNISVERYSSCEEAKPKNKGE